jgi:hypothetical protein
VSFDLKLTASGSRETYDSAEAKHLDSLAEFEKKRLGNDPSKKNLSSIVFLAKIPGRQNILEWTALFTGDASALTVFNDESRIEKMPLTIDLMKGLS